MRLILTKLVRVPTESNPIRLRLGFTTEGPTMMKAKKKTAKKAAKKPAAKKKKR